MSEIYTLDSDALLLDSFSECIRNREIEQKYIYFGQGWEWYYDWENNFKYKNEKWFNPDDFKSFFDKAQMNSENSEGVIISLGCGNSAKEALILEKLNNNIHYFGIDSSHSMLSLSIKELWHLQNPKTFLCADFSTKAFRTELKQLTKFSKNRLFVFFSNTFWNIQHTNIIDILWNLLHKWEKIWLDVTVRQWTWIKEDFEMWQRMSDLFHNDETKSFFIKPITRLWIKPDDIELIIKTKKENFINALKFDFYYLIKNRSEINIKWEKIVILPNEEIKFLQIYTYDQYGLIDFFEEHDFKLVDKNLKGYRWQFLFEKK